MTTSTLKNDLLKQVFGGISYTPPTGWVLGISTTEISKDGSNITEPDASTGYFRCTVANTTDNWEITADGYISNKVRVEMTELDLGTSSITVMAYFLSDSTTGNAVIWKNLAEGERKTLSGETQLAFKPGNIEFSLLDRETVSGS